MVQTKRANIPGRKREKPPTKRRVYRPGSERRVEIVAAARAAFVNSNYQGARTRDIARAAGVNEATLFKHFPTKEALFEAAVMEPLQEAMRGMHERIRTYEGARAPAEMGALAEASTVRHLQDMQAVFPLLATALFSDLEIGKKLYREQLAPLIRQRGTVLRTLTRKGIDPEFVGLATFGMLFAVAMQQRFSGRKKPLAVIAAQLNRFSTGGFARSGVRPKRPAKRKASAD